MVMSVASIVVIIGFVFVGGLLLAIAFAVIGNAVKKKKNSDLESYYQQRAAEQFQNQPVNGVMQESDESSVGDVTVMLMDSGVNKVMVIKMIRDLTGLGLKEAKDLADYAPSVILQNVSEEKAEQVRCEFEAKGAKVELR